MDERKETKTTHETGRGPNAVLGDTIADYRAAYGYPTLEQIIDRNHAASRLQRSEKIISTLRTMTESQIQQVRGAIAQRIQELGHKA